MGDDVMGYGLMDDLGLKDMIMLRTCPDLRVGDRVLCHKTGRYGTVVWTRREYNPFENPDIMCRIAIDGEPVPMYFDLPGLERYQVEIVEHAP